MSFQPVIPFAGYTGWTFLKRTMAAQQQSFQASAANQREEAYFRKKIGSVASAADLVSDRRLLRVALTAFGLEADVDAKAFIRKLLEGGTSDSSALANKLADKRYLAFAKAFDFSTMPPATAATDFADKVLAQYATKLFETAVGNQDDSMRLALNAETEVAALATSVSSENTKWFSIMGSKPLREVFETAFGLPSGFANLDIDRQLTILKSRAQSLFGKDSVSQFNEPEAMSKLIRTYLVRAEASGSSYSSASTALQLLMARRG